MKNFYSNPAFEAKRILIDEELEARRKREAECHRRNQKVIQRINSGRARVLIAA